MEIKPMDFNVASSNPNSTLTKDAELNAAFNRGASQSDADKANLAYATARGWKPTTPVIGVSDTPKINDSTDDIAEKNAQTNAYINNSLKDKEEEPSTVIKTLTDQLNKINTITDEELKSIEEAGAAAGAEYDPLIADAQSKRKTTLASDIVRAGQRGGFESTQLAGQAAIANTTPQNGEVFVGAGGALDQSRIILDRNISYLQAKKMEAVAAAKAAQRKAITTGKREDYTNAVDLVKLADELQANIDNRTMQKETLAINKQKLALDQASTASSIAKNAFDIISKVDKGQSVTIDGVTYEGINTPDPTKSFFSGSDIVALMKSIPVGQSTQMTDPLTGTTYTIQGLSSEQPDYLTATDDRGNVTFVDKTTLQPVKTISGIGKTKTQAANVSINMNNEQKADLADALAYLEANKGADGKYDTGKAIKAVADYGAKHPGKSNQLLDVIKNSLNTDNPEARQLITGTIPKQSGFIEMQGANGVKIKVPTN